MNKNKTWSEWKETLLSREIEAIEENYIISKELEISPTEVFIKLLEYEGIIGYDYWIKSTISRVYGVEIE